MDADEARARFGAARVAHLATAGADGMPHVVPVTFAVTGDVVVFAVDHKPKRTTDLRRLRNIRENPRVGFLVDHYDEDWDRLWWARADGVARIHQDGSAREAAVAALVGKYPQYQAQAPGGPVVVTTISRWSGWSARPAPPP
ncbi:TIGR03668 family PPOX class F420-dependent oxidoreductase [Nonomuraea sp. NN258]|uniref:TIGR03668 family PPOX class F420-dependent oxidoreductase n=1 Tax=Nonomuraea antri TaxID=2730852 RepID=UPI001569B107|nr:TIGR03668 family PPOX class F420-dependent oxidoreductase [Nonomuraea antri]NRQ35062.1 TIGR03668 family PPOX class F420-dependent oxidoreductase [Nonomuraea antri]